MNLNTLFENISPQQRRVGQLPADFSPRDTSPVLDGPYGKENATQGYLVGEGAGDNALQVGDPVIITGNVEYQGKTGDVREIGRDGAFVVVDLYNYGPYSFHASDVSLNDYADSDEEDERAQGVAEGLDEAVGGNYLYHATSAGGLKGMLSSGSIRSATGPQAATKAQTKLPTVSVTRDWGYASGIQAQSQLGGIGRDAILVLDRNAVESNFKTLSTSQSTIVKGLSLNPYLTKSGEARSQNTDPAARANAKAKMKYAEPTAKAGGEFEEAVVVPKGALPLKGTMVGFWINPKSELMRDPAIMNDPRRLDMVRPNQFVKATQQQGVTETALRDKADLVAKRRALQDLSRNPGVDQRAVQQRQQDLEKEARSRGLNEFALDDGDDPTEDYPCYDCGSTIFLHHTKACDLAEPNAKRDLPAKPGTQYWTGQVPKGLAPIPGLAEGVELMTDAEVYRETLGVLALMATGFAAGAYAKIKDIVKMYNADQIMKALEGYSVSNISDSERKALIKLIAEFKQAMAQRQGKQALAIAKQIKSIATDRAAVAEAGFETEPVKLNPGDAVTYQGAPAEVMSVAGNSVTLRHGGTTKSVPANTVSEAVDYAVMVGESVKRVFPVRVLAENYAAQLQQRRPQATVTVAEQHTTEDVVSAIKDRVGDYLQNVADAVKKDPELLDKIAAAADDLGSPVKTITTADGHEIKIHGNEDDGFRISIQNQALKSRFPKMEHAVMATEMYCARRQQQKTNSDYLPEA